MELASSTTWKAVELLRCSKVPDVLAHLVCLEGLVFKKCTFSNTLTIPKLTNLQRLELIDCNRLTEVVLASLPKLKHLLLQVCINVEVDLLETAYAQPMFTPANAVKVYPMHWLSTASCCAGCAHHRTLRCF